MSIFISIASYEDPTLQRTLTQAIEKSDNPESLFFGICIQHTKEPDISFIPESQVSIIRFNPEERPGISKVRYLLKKMFRQQDYFLQIDSHMEFEQSWDTRLINQLKELKEFANNENVIISTPRELFEDRIILKPKISGNDNWFTIRAFYEDAANYSHKFHKSSYIRAGMLFADKKFVNTIDFCKYTHSTDEEAYLTFQTIISGWDIYEVPYDTLIWHSPKEYYDVVWNNKKHRTLMGSYQDNEYEMHLYNLAYIYNDYSKYRVETAIMPARDFWIKLGFDQEYIKYKKILDKKMHNDFIV